MGDSCCDKEQRWMIREERGQKMKLSTARQLRFSIPTSIRPMAKGLASRFLPGVFKYQEEENFWDDRWRAGDFGNGYYMRHMLGLAGEATQDFIAGKIVADFGCGPQGSLAWATQASVRIGIDVLADAYSRYDIRKHGMCYVASTERSIPLPTNFVDVMFTMNAMDHVNNFSAMCAEVGRVIVPGGSLFASFNLGEPPTFTEPQSLTERAVTAALAKHFTVLSTRVAPRGPEGDVYKYCHEPESTPIAPLTPRHLWVRATKRRIG
jgi:SAM-dependent methyltransferase